MRLTGFWRDLIALLGVAPMAAKGSKVKRMWIDFTDAPMLWLREAEKLANHVYDRVGLPRPSTIHQEASL
jgi:hypothetical protein